MGYDKRRRPGLQPGGPVATEGDIPTPPAAGVQDTLTITADHALALADLGKLILADVDALGTITIADQADIAWPDGGYFDVMLIGTGPVAVAPADAAAVTPITGKDASISTVHGQARVRRIGEDDWVISGDLDDSA